LKAEEMKMKKDGGVCSEGSNTRKWGTSKLLEEILLSIRNDLASMRFLLINKNSMSYLYWRLSSIVDWFGIIDQTHCIDAA
jgi:hypothetical protein